MPCDASHCAPNNRERESRAVCQHLIYLWDRLECAIPTWVFQSADSIYGNVERLDEATNLLCDACSIMAEDDKDRIIYDGRNPKARRLADWWDAHKEADAEKHGYQKRLERVRSFLEKVKDEGMLFRGVWINDLDAGELRKLVAYLGKRITDEWMP